jgi:hypothetical protein
MWTDFLAFRYNGEGAGLMERWKPSTYFAFILRQHVSPRKTFHSKMFNDAVHWLVRRIESLLLIIGPCRDTCREFLMHRNDWCLLLAGRCETRLLLTSRTNVWFSGRPSVGSGCSRKASFLGMGRNTGCAGYPWFFIDARRSYITVRSVRSHYSLPASPCTRIKKEVRFIHVPQESW